MTELAVNNSSDVTTEKSGSKIKVSQTQLRPRRPGSASQVQTKEELEEMPICLMCHMEERVSELAAAGLAVRAGLETNHPAVFSQSVTRSDSLSQVHKPRTT